MPYDPNKSKSLLRIIGAYDQHPFGDTIKQLGTLLKEAEGEISEANRRASDSETRLGKVETDLEVAQQTVRRLRNGSSGLNDAIDALKSISLNPKGASKVAKTVLDKMGHGGDSPL
jgi:chromosome segregation ATPase